MTNADFLVLWYEALASPLGIKVPTDNPERAKARLYAARREALDPDLETVAIVVMGADELWLVRKL